MSERVRVAQVGVGGMGRSHVAAVRGSERAELVSACDVSPDALHAVAAGGPIETFADLATMFRDSRFDALIAVLPHDEYPRAVDLAAAHGIHLLKEKPFAKDLADALEMHALVSHAGIRFLCAAQRQYAKPFLRAKEILDQGGIGEVFLVDGRITYCWKLDAAGWGWRGEGRRSGGIAVIDSGWHLLDAVAWLKGLPSSVYCRIGRMKAAAGHYDVDDKAVLALDFPDGAVGCLTTCYLTTPNRFELMLHGTEGTLELNPQRLLIHPRGAGEPEVVEDDGTDVMAAQFEHFLDVVLDGAEPRVGIDDALQIQRVIEAAYESAGRGERVDLPQL